MIPYAVPFRSVWVYPSSALLDGLPSNPRQLGMRGDSADDVVLNSMNGSIVGLCYRDLRNGGGRNAIDSGTPCAPILLDCAGLGIVRSVDRARELFFVLTPVHPRLLAGVSCLVGGTGVSLPLECVYRGVHSDSFPFLSGAHSHPSGVSRRPGPAST